MKNKGRPIIMTSPDPGDMSQARHLAQSRLYKVEIKDTASSQFQSSFVYETDNYAGDRFQNEKRPQQSAAFTFFSFEECTVDVRITCLFEAQSVMIRPSDYGICSTLEGNVISFTLDRPRKISVEVNDRLNPLFLFADRPEEPDVDATYYYGPGFHDIGLNKVIRSKESVYIAAGAVVQGSFFVQDEGEDVRIRGRGILNVGNPTPTNDCSWLAQNCTISAKKNRHLRIEGLILTNAAAWTVCITGSSGWDMPNASGKLPGGAYDNQFRNLKLVSWNGNSDGIWFDGDHALVEDCFIFNNDDGVTTHGSNHCIIRNIVFWGGPWGRFFMHFDWASSSDITFEDIHIIGKEDGEALILFCGREGVKTTCTLYDFRFRNIWAEDFRGQFMAVTARNVRFSGLEMDHIFIQ